MKNQIKNKINIEAAFFVSLLVVSAYSFFQEYFYIIIPDHKPFWIPGSLYNEPTGVPLTIIGIIGLIIFAIWYIFRGKEVME